MFQAIVILECDSPSQNPTFGHPFTSEDSVWSFWKREDSLERPMRVWIEDGTEMDDVVV